MRTDGRGVEQTLGGLYGIREIVKKMRIENPFEYLKIDPGTPAGEITKVCQKLIESANPEECERIKNILTELRDERKRLSYVLFSYHGVETVDSDWELFLRTFRRVPFKLKEILPKNVSPAAEAHTLKELLEKIERKEEPERNLTPEDLEKRRKSFDPVTMTVEFLEGRYG